MQIYSFVIHFTIPTRLPKKPEARPLWRLFPTNIPLDSRSRSAALSYCGIVDAALICVSADFETTRVQRAVSRRVGYVMTAMCYPSVGMCLAKLDLLPSVALHGGALDVKCGSEEAPGS